MTETTVQTDPDAKIPPEVRRRAFVAVGLLAYAAVSVGIMGYKFGLTHEHSENNANKVEAARYARCLQEMRASGLSGSVLRASEITASLQANCGLAGIISDIKSDYKNNADQNSRTLSTDGKLVSSVNPLVQLPSVTSVANEIAEQQHDAATISYLEPTIDGFTGGMIGVGVWAAGIFTFAKLNRYRDQAEPASLAPAVQS